MIRSFIGAIAGFVVWSVLWIGSDQVIMSLSPDWYGTHQLAFERAITNGAPFSPESSILLLHLVRSIVISVLSGFIAAIAAGENRRAPFILGILLLLVGIMVEAMAWNYLPVWYHVVFLALLIPAAIVGGKLKKA